MATSPVTTAKKPVPLPPPKPKTVPLPPPKPASIALIPAGQDSAILNTILLQSQSVQSSPIQANYNDASNSTASPSKSSTPTIEISSSNGTTNSAALVSGKSAGNLLQGKGIAAAPPKPAPAQSSPQLTSPSSIVSPTHQSTPISVTTISAFEKQEPFSNEVAGAASPPTQRPKAPIRPRSQHIATLVSKPNPNDITATVKQLNVKQEDFNELMKAFVEMDVDGDGMISIIDLLKYRIGGIKGDGPPPYFPASEYLPNPPASTELPALSGATTTSNTSIPAIYPKKGSGETASTSAVEANGVIQPRLDTIYQELVPTTFNLQPIPVLTVAAIPIKSETTDADSLGHAPDTNHQEIGSDDETTSSDEDLKETRALLASMNLPDSDDEIKQEIDDEPQHKSSFVLPEKPKGFKYDRAELEARARDYKGDDSSDDDALLADWDGTPEGEDSQDTKSTTKESSDSIAAAGSPSSSGSLSSKMGKFKKSLSQKANKLRTKLKSDHY